MAVLGYGPRKDLFPNRDPMGKTLRIYGQPYLIVGTMAERKHIIGALGDNYVCVPWTTFEKDGLQARVRGPQHRPAGRRRVRDRRGHLQHHRHPAP